MVCWLIKYHYSDGHSYIFIIANYLSTFILLGGVWGPQSILLEAFKINICVNNIWRLFLYYIVCSLLFYDLFFLYCLFDRIRGYWDKASFGFSSSSVWSVKIGNTFTLLSNVQKMLIIFLQINNLTSLLLNY